MSPQGLFSALVLLACLQAARTARAAGWAAVAAAGLTLGVAAGVGGGVTRGPALWAWALAAATSAGVVAAWAPLAVRGGPARGVLALALLAAGLWLNMTVLAAAAGPARAAAAGSDPITRALAWSCASLLLMEPATRVCRLVLKLAGRVPALATVPVGARPARGMGPGEVIGILERWVVLALLVGQAYAALGFIVTAKTLARHKQMEEREFAEYFLIGTLTSVLSAMAVAAGLRRLLGA